MSRFDNRNPDIGFIEDYVDVQYIALDIEDKNQWGLGSDITAEEARLGAEPISDARAQYVMQAIKNELIVRNEITTELE